MPDAKEKILFFLMRHGSTENNIDNNYRGWSNSKNAQLSAKGREEVRQTAMWLKRSVPDISFILADDLDRTKETARIVADVLDLSPDQVDFDKRLRPINVGDFTGKSKDEHPLTEYLKDKSKVIPGGESLSTFNRRQSKVFADIMETVEKVDGTVLIIGHGSNISYLHNHFNKKEGEIGYEGAVNPAGVISFSKSGITPLKNIRTGSKDTAKPKNKNIVQISSGVREIMTFPIGPDGLFKDTGEYDAVKEEHLRQGFFQLFQYTDTHCGNPRTYDPNGNYVCKDCNKFIDGECLLVYGDISGDKGSCRHWENLDAGDPELDFAVKISKEFADYGETTYAGFGCKRCQYRVEAAEKDSIGRDDFCRQGAFRVADNACCALNTNPTMKTVFPETAAYKAIAEKADSDPTPPEDESEKEK